MKYMIARNHILGPEPIEIAHGQIRKHLVFVFVTAIYMVSFLKCHQLPSPFIQAAVTQMMFQKRHSTNPARVQGMINKMYYPRINMIDHN